MMVCDLKNSLNNIIEYLDQFEDMADVKLSPNTYGINGDFLYLNGSIDRGYIDLNNLEITGD